MTKLDYRCKYGMGECGILDEKAPKDPILKWEN